MSEGLDIYSYFPPSAKLVEGIATYGLTEFRAKPIDPTKEDVVREVYAQWANSLKDYQKTAQSMVGDIDPIRYLRQYFEFPTMPTGSTYGAWLDRLLSIHSNVNRLKKGIENEIRKKIGEPEEIIADKEYRYVSNIAILEREYKQRYSESKPQSYVESMEGLQSIKQPMMSKISNKAKIIIAIAIVVVILVVIFTLMRKEKMYGPSDILVGRQQLVRIATMPRPIPPNYSRWY
jgi:hypothetical protein